MNYSMRCSLGLVVLAALTQFNVHAANAPAGFIDFGDLSPGDSGCDFVEVNVNSNLISMAARLAPKGEPEIAELLKGLRSIRVNVIELNNENRADIESRIKSIRGQLNTEGWERIVTAKQKKDDVGVYLKTKGQEAVEGVVVTVVNGKKQAVLINVVGNIKPEMLGELGERFNIEPLKKLGPTMKKEKPEQDDAEKEDAEKE